MQESYFMTVHEITEKAKELSDIEKLVVIDALLAALNQSDPEIDAIWAQEIRRRRQAYREGRLSTSDYEEVMARIMRK